MQKKINSISGIDRAHRRVIFASSLGTVFEWYDFYLYGSLSIIIARQFFAGVDETTGFIFALLSFAAGFFVRPFGALVFGRLGDRVGRKRTFLITIVLMGVSTALVGVLPSYNSIGVVAPLILIGLRLIQGLALGGEYGGAAIYVAEHAPAGKRGLYTSWIQTTATLGLFLSLIVILGCRLLFTEDFENWGWRVPFLLSTILLGISIYIRVQLQESPAFLRLKKEGKLAHRPIAEAFGNRNNLRLVLLALFGATAGQAVVWYCGQFYVLFFLEKILRLDAISANLIVATALLLGMPLFVIFGALSDRIGRKTIVVSGCILAACTYFPTFKAITHAANPALERAVSNSPVSVFADPNDCSFQFDPVGRQQFRHSCDIAKSALMKAGVPYSNIAAPLGTAAEIWLGENRQRVIVTSFDGATMNSDAFEKASGKFNMSVRAALDKSGYTSATDLSAVDLPLTIALCFWLIVLVAMVYGPIAAWLVELFPTNIRYTSMSLPYHLGNGWFGGFLPVMSFAIVAATGDIYAGLWYPVIIAFSSAIIGLLFLPETKTIAQS